MADEYIERRTAYSLAKKVCKAVDSNPRVLLPHIILDLIDDLPTADVQPVRHGRWNEESPDCLDGDSVYVCSVCGETWTLIEGTPLDNNMHYCPNCGAKMEEEPK